MTVTKYPDVHVQLVGTDGNAYAVIGAVAKAIRKAHGPDEATKFVEEATQSDSYDALLAFCMNTVDVT